MPENTSTILPLYHFFEQLRQNDFPLGTGEYEKFLHALQQVFGLGPEQYHALLNALDKRSFLTNEETLYPKDKLLNICKLLWLKPHQSLQLFEDLFEATYRLDFQLPKNAPVKQTETPAVRPDEEAATKTGKEKSMEVHEEERVPEQDVEQELPGTTEAIADDSPAEIALRVGFSEYKQSNELLIKKNAGIETEKSKFLFTKFYFPVERRKLVQNIKLFPGHRNTYTTNEPDIERTIEKTTANGFFKEIVFKKQQLSSSRLVLLIDQHDSMIAFDHFADTLKHVFEKTLSPGKKIKKQSFSSFYFYNAAATNFFTDKDHMQSKSVSSIVEMLKGKGSNVIVISDAGAARSHYNNNTITAASQLLARLRQHTSKIAWLNPMPKDRWQDTPAESIAEMVAMYEANENGIKNTIAFLKGASPKLVRMI